jgi:hypothetical protein
MYAVPGPVPRRRTGSQVPRHTYLSATDPGRGFSSEPDTPPVAVVSRERGWRTLTHSSHFAAELSRS